MIAALPIPELTTCRPQRPIHVLTLTPFYPAQGDDGQGCFVAEPLSWTQRRGVMNTVITAQPFYRGRAAANGSAVQAQSMRFFALPSGWGLPTSGAFLFARIVREVRRLHLSNPVHVIHAHSALPCGHAAALLSQRLRVPFVVTVHGLDAYFTKQVGGHSAKYCARVSQLVYRSARRVICVSEKVRDQVMEGASAPVRAEVAYNGVDPQVFVPMSRATAPEVILSVGNLIPTKGHEVLLRAVAAIQVRFPNLSCEIVGDGPEWSRLIALTQELKISGRVRFLGRQNRDQVAEAMRRCTVFALPSRYEGLGCVYLEAMSAAKPVIACRGQGIEEIIEHGINGYLVDAGEQRGLGNALSELLGDERRRREMGEAARRTILQSHTLDHQAARLVQLYREVCE